MMVETKNYTKRDTITYLASACIWSTEQEYPEQVWSGEFLSYKAAELAIRDQFVADSAIECGNIYRGTYRINNFDDEEYGRILDAEWIEDENVSWYLYRDYATRSIIIEQS